jgi:putative glycosyltransferase (TIGR04348 family)
MARVLLLCPAGAGRTSGNRTTAERWARLLRGIGHRVRVQEEWCGEPCELLVALHARRSADSVLRFREARPDGALLVALTGTDLYGDLPGGDAAAAAAVAAASRLLALQPLAAAALPEGLRASVRVIRQSAGATGRTAASPRKSRHFEVCVLAHLRAVKDPLLPARATRLLPPGTRLRVTHAGAAIEADLGRAARRESRLNPRWRWVGELSRGRAALLLRRSRVCVLPSRAEGGANVISEACVAGVPLLASRVDGSVGLLSGDHPGLFPAGDADALAALLLRCEREPAFTEELAAWSRALGPGLSEAAESDAWARLLDELGLLRSALPLA